LPDGERRARLDSITDAPIKEELRSLLEAHELSSAFIETPAIELAAELAAKDPPPDMTGRKLGPYVISSPIGSGGMGEIYLARHTRLDRDVALKLLPSHFTSDPQRLARFTQEARAVSALNHPNIITIFDVGHIEEIHFIATEYVEGQTLRQLVKTRLPGLRVSLEIGAQIASALDAAHRAGIIHRDIKPENVMVRPDGFIKVLDFGLAKLIEGEIDSGDAVRTTAGLVMGTPQYMSPEQARGKSVDTRTDIFSLGVVLYEMLTGRPPFVGDTPSDVIAAILMKEPEPLPSLAEAVPMELEQVISRALNKELAGRYQNAADMLADLKRIKNRLELEAELDSGGFSRASHSSSASGSHSAHRDYASGARSSGASQVIDSIAVLPLENGGNDPNTEYLSDGITESIINNLSQLPQIKVMARSTVFRYKGRDLDAQSAGRELGVRAALAGGVRLIGEQLVISLELVDVADGSQMWGERYNRKLDDIFQLQEEISKEVSDKLRLKLTGEERLLLAKRHTENPEAYQLYLKGRYYSGKKDFESFRKGLDFFNQAIEKDPAYALAYAGLADTYYRLSNTYLPPHEAWPKAIEAAERALTLDDQLAEAHTSMGAINNWYRWRWSDAERDYKRAIALNPGYALAHSRYGSYLAVMGRADEAIASLKRALEIDPFALGPNTTYAVAFYFARRYAEALDQCRKTIDMEPGYHPVHEVAAWVHEQRGEFREAISELERAYSLGGAGETLATFAYVYARAGRREDALRVLEELKEESRRKYVSPYALATAYSALGEKDLAFEWLEIAYRDRSEYMATIKVDPKIDAIRDDPRFLNLVRCMGYGL
jgi:serine/threonine-protein kinase